MFDFAKKIVSARTGEVHLFSVGQAGFIIKSASGRLLGIDLYLSDCVERAEGSVGFKRLLPKILSTDELEFDALICTHPHLDHFDVDSVPEMLGNGKTRLYCSVDCEKLIKQTYMDYCKDRIKYVKPADSFIDGDFEIQFVNCDHGQGAPDAVGVVVKVNGRTIYEAGDTCLRLDRVSEIIQPLDVLIAPINGKYGNMDHRDCVLLAEALKPKVTIPCHYGMFASHGGDLKGFYDLMMQKDLPMLLMTQGDRYTF